MNGGLYLCHTSCEHVGFALQGSLEAWLKKCYKTISNLDIHTLNVCCQLLWHISPLIEVRHSLVLDHPLLLLQLLIHFCLSQLIPFDLYSCSCSSPYSHQFTLLQLQTWTILQLWTSPRTDSADLAKIWLLYQHDTFTSLELLLKIRSTVSSHPRTFQPWKILLTEELSHRPLIRVELRDVQTPPSPNLILTIWTKSLHQTCTGHLHIV